LDELHEFLLFTACTAAASIRRAREGEASPPRWRGGVGRWNRPRGRGSKYTA